MNAANEIREAEKSIVKLAHELMNANSKRRETILKKLEKEIEKYDAAEALITTWAKPRKAA